MQHLISKQYMLEVKNMLGIILNTPKKDLSKTDTDKAAAHIAKITQSTGKDNGQKK